MNYYSIFDAAGILYACTPDLNSAYELSAELGGYFREYDEEKDGEE